MNEQVNELVNDILEKAIKLQKTHLAKMTKEDRMGAMTLFKGFISLLFLRERQAWRQQKQSSQPSKQ